jgi:hypothetical protein
MSGPGDLPRQAEEEEEPEELTVKFSVRTLDGLTSFEVAEPESALVADVKQRLARLLGVDGTPAVLKLLLWGCDLDDTKTIYESKVPAVLTRADC